MGYIYMKKIFEFPLINPHLLNFEVFLDGAFPIVIQRIIPIEGIPYL